MLHFLNLHHLKETLREFPLATIYILLLTIAWFVFLHSTIEEAFMLHLIFTLILTFFLSVGVSLYTAESNFSPVKKYLCQLLPIILGVLFYVGFAGERSYEDEAYYLFFLLLTFVIAFLFSAPYVITKKSKKADDLNVPYSQYFLKVVSVFLFGFVLGGLAFGLGALAILAVQLLFQVGTGDAFQHWAILSMVFLSPLVCLTKLPLPTQTSEPHFSLNIFSSFIIKFIFLPAIFIYFVILYVYTMKVLVHFSDRPQGEISRLVIAFSIIGYLTYLLSYFFKELPIVHRFRKLFPFVVIPQLFMLFYAIYLRIAQYDLTVNRYFVVIFGIWLLVTSLYFICSQRKLLLVLPATLALFAGLISFGPWGAFNLPITRQLDRLEKNLEKAGMLVDGQVIPLKGEIDARLESELYDGIRYICDFDCKKFTTGLGKGVVQETDSFYDIRESLNLQYSQTLPSSEPEQIMTFYFEQKDQAALFPIETEGYDFITRADIGDYNLNGDYLTITEGELTENFDLSEIKSTLLSKVSQTSYSTNLSKEELTFNLGGEKFTIKLIISYCRLNNPQYEGESFMGSDYIEGYVLVKRK